MQNISYGEFNKINSINFTSEYGKLKNIKLEGSTTQSTRSGKNIFNKKAKIIENGVTKSVLDTGVRITQTHAGKYRYGGIRLGGSELLGKTLRISANWTKSADNVPYIAIYLGNSSSMALYRLFGTGVSGQIIQITIPNAFPAVGEQVCDTVYILLYSNRDGTGNVGDYVDYTDLIVTVDNDDMTYEDYGVSPSSDYRSPIENVEGKNKFDINQEKEIFGIMLYKYSYYLKPNTKYTISSNCPASTTANIYANSNSSNSAVYINKNQTIQSDENGYFYILVRFKADASDSSTFNLYEKVLNGTYYIQLEEGTVATPYVPYNSLEIKNVGENLFNPSNAKDGYVSDGSGQIISVNIKNKNTGYIKIDGEEKYFILSNKLTGNWGAWYDKDKKFISGITLGSKNKGIVTAPNNAYFINFTVSYENNNPDYANNVMIARSDKEIPYKPYQEQKINFPLSEGQKLYEGSYLADDGIHHKRKQYVITGNETIEKIWIDDDTHHVFAIKASLPVPQISDKTYKEYLCNTYRVLNYDGGIDSIWANRKDNNTNYTTAMAIDYANSSLSLRGRIIIKDMSIDDIDKMKTYLSEQHSNGTPVIVEYGLSEEEIVPYTEAQQEAWNKIENFPIFIGQNNLTSTALLSAIYIKKITTDTKVDYNLYNEDYIKIATKNNIHPKFKIQMLDEYENVIDEITGDISRDNSGSISNNYQQGVRRSVSLTFIDTEGKFLPDSNSNLIWANKKFKLFSGLLDTDTNEIFWFSEGVYYFSNVSSSRNGADKLTTVNGVDKFGKFGSELGYNQLESTYLIPAGTKIYDAIKGILNIDIGNGYPIDPIEPVLDPLYIDEVCPYDISKSPSSYLSEMLIELADIIGCDIYYDADGRLHVDSGTIDSSYSNKPSIWDFSDVLPEYMNPSITTNFAEFINTVKVVGNNTNDKTYEYTAVNNNPESPTRVDLIGTKSTYIESASVYNTDRAKDYAEYKLNMFSILQLAVTFSCTFLPHLDVNKVITITDSYYKYEKQRFVIQSITLPLSYDGVMSISACNVASLPYYEGGN